MNTLITISSLSLYVASAALLARRLFRTTPDVTARFKRVALFGGLLALSLHAVALFAALHTPTGLNVGFFNMLSLTTWLIAAVVVVSAFRHPLENLGIVLLPLAAVGLALQELFPSPASQITHTDPGLDIHILLSIASYSVLAIAAVQSLLLALQDHQLRNRKPGGFIRALPPLETMERLLFRMIGIGYLLLSLALISGAHYFEDIFAQHMVHKTILSIAAWVVFAILLWGRWRFGWRGRIAIRWTLSGFAILMLAYFGSKLVKELILHH
jgi:ABC-type uncharacterized transport system permease subunit